MESQTVMQRYSVRIAIASGVSAPAINVGSVCDSLALDAAILAGWRIAGAAGVCALLDFFRCHSISPFVGSRMDG
jgi:hypothetical protein